MWMSQWCCDRRGSSNSTKSALPKDMCDGMTQRCQTAAHMKERAACFRPRSVTARVLDRATLGIQAVRVVCPVALPPANEGGGAGYYAGAAPSHSLAHDVRGDSFRSILRPTKASFARHAEGGSTAVPLQDRHLARRGNGRCSLISSLPRRERRPINAMAPPYATSSCRMSHRRQSLKRMPSENCVVSVPPYACLAVMV